MVQWHRVLLLITCLIWPLGVQAGWLQYQTATGFITGGPRTTSEGLPIVEGHDVIEDPALSVTTPVWPSPAGCETGQQTWTKLSPGNVLPLIARTDLVWLTSTSSLMDGCKEVSGWHQLRRFVESTIITAVNENPLLIAFNALNVATYIAVCPTSVGSANCVNARAAMDDLNDTPSVFPGPGALLSFLQSVQTLRTDAINLKTVQGW